MKTFLDVLKHIKCSLIFIICLSLSIPPHGSWAADAPPPVESDTSQDEDAKTEGGLQCDGDCEAAKPASTLEKIPIQKIETDDRPTLLGRAETASSGGSLLGGIDWNLLLGIGAIGAIAYFGYKAGQENYRAQPKPWYNQPQYPGPIYNRPPPFLPYQPTYMGNGMPPAILPYGVAQPYGGQSYMPQPYTLNQPFGYSTGFNTQPQFQGGMLGGVPLGTGGYTLPPYQQMQYVSPPPILPYYLPY